MRRISTTVVALVGEPARACLVGLGRAANIRTVPTDPEASPLERATVAWQTATGSHRPYLLHDADPLAAVADAWVRRFDEQAPAGELEVAVAETLGRWRAGAVELPDYYLVLDVEGWQATRRHWYLGVLHRAAPSRVQPAPGSPAAVRERLAALAAGRWWPDMDRLLDGIDRVVPDRP
jgi:hypothetical protein